jgi:hypothetical protein
MLPMLLESRIPLPNLGAASVQIPGLEIHAQVPMESNTFALFFSFP